MAIRVGAALAAISLYVDFLNPVDGPPFRQKIQIFPPNAVNPDTRFFKNDYNRRRMRRTEFEACPSQNGVESMGPTPLQRRTPCIRV